VCAPVDLPREDNVPHFRLSTLVSFLSSRPFAVMANSLGRSQAVRVLFADDDPAIRGSFARAVKGAGYDVDLAEDGSVALQRAREHKYSVFAMDFDMPGQAGVELVRQ